MNTELLKKGIVFGRLTVIGLDHVKQIQIINSRNHKPYIANKEYYLCQCECGNKKVVLKNDLKSNKTQSCGCLQKEICSKKCLERNYKHGHVNSRLYNTWNRLKQRCLNFTNKNYPNYGARGITVCDEWLNNFQSFYDWAISSGYKDGLTIDRIDNDGNYCPENCRWATPKQQANNRRSNRLITYKGKTKTVSEWCDLLDLKYDTVLARINRNWPVAKAFS